ANWKN
ncbi:hypothetical protein VCHE40_3225B, partial [Vibrio cholerae HE-40]